MVSHDALHANADVFYTKSCKCLYFWDGLKIDTL